MRNSLLLPVVVALALSAPHALRAQDDDRIIAGKKISAWVMILKTSEEPRQRRAALIVLQQAGPKVMNVLSAVGQALYVDKDEGIRIQAAAVLGTLGAKAVELNETKVERIPLKAAIEALKQALAKDKSPRVREEAARAIGRIGKDAHEAVPTLVAALTDENADTRAAAAENLAVFGFLIKEGLDDMIKVLRQSKAKEELRVRLGIVMAMHRLGKADGIAALPALLEMLREPAPTGMNADERRRYDDVRRVAVQTLGAFQDVGAADSLAKVLDQAIDAREPVLAREALTALTQLGGNKSALLPVFIKAMSPPPGKLQDQFVRAQAMHIISQLGKELGSERKTVVDVLRRGLTDKVSEVRLAAILALSELGPEIIGPELPGVLQELKALERSTERAIADAAKAASQKLR